MNELLLRYIRRIKNPGKRAYAFDYLAYKRGQLAEPPGYDCSTMAAQGVRMQIDATMDGIICKP